MHFCFQSHNVPLQKQNVGVWGREDPHTSREGVKESIQAQLALPCYISTMASWRWNKRREPSSVEGSLARKEDGAVPLCLKGAPVAELQRDGLPSHCSHWGGAIKAQKGAMHK